MRGEPALRGSGGTRFAGNRAISSGASRRKFTTGNTRARNKRGKIIIVKKFGDARTRARPLWPRRFERSRKSARAPARARIAERETRNAKRDTRYVDAQSSRAISTLLLPFSRIPAREPIWPSAGDLCSRYTIISMLRTPQRGRRGLRLESRCRGVDLPRTVATEVFAVSSPIRAATVPSRGREARIGGPRRRSRRSAERGAA